MNTSLTERKKSKGTTREKKERTNKRKNMGSWILDAVHVPNANFEKLVCTNYELKERSEQCFMWLNVI